MDKIAALNADAKLVYNGTVDDLAALAEKYGVTTNSLNYAKKYRSDAFRSLGAQAFKTNSDVKEIRGRLYAAIKGQLRQAGR